MPTPGGWSDTGGPFEASLPGRILDVFVPTEDQGRAETEAAGP